MEIQKFNPTKAEIQKAVDAANGLTINGVADEVGYATVKAAKKTLADYRNNITKFGKEQRAEAIKWQKEVLRQEKELVAMIEPTENKLKADLEAIDKEKMREERRILLPTRKKLMEDIGNVIDDDFLLDMDEKAFAVFYGERRLDYDAMVQRQKEKEEERKRQEKEIEEAKEQAKKEAEEKAEREKKEEAERVEREKKEAEKKKQEELKKKEEEKIEAIKKAEREKQEAIDKIKREQEEKERKRKEKEKAEKLEAEEKERLEKVAREKLEKAHKYQEWLEKNGVDKSPVIDFTTIKITLDSGKTKIYLYKKIDEIII